MFSANFAPRPSRTTAAIIRSLQDTTKTSTTPVGFRDSNGRVRFPGDGQTLSPRANGGGAQLPQNPDAPKALHNLSWVDKAPLAAVRQKIARLKKTEDLLTKKTKGDMWLSNSLKHRLKSQMGFTRMMSGRKPARRIFAPLQKALQEITEKVDHPLRILKNIRSLREAVEARFKDRLTAEGIVSGGMKVRSETSKERQTRFDLRESRRDISNSSKKSREMRIRFKASTREMLLDPTQRGLMFDAPETDVPTAAEAARLYDFAGIAARNAAEVAERRGASRSDVTMSRYRWTRELQAKAG